LSNPVPSNAAPWFAAVATPAVDVTSFRSDLREADIEDMVESLLAMFLTDSPERLIALEDAVAVQNAEAIESAAHAFKSGAGAIRATGLAHLLRDAEEAARAGRSESSSQMLEQVRVEYAAVRHQLEALLNKTA
jgi:HPt (histidine-containing phosphotransfer) domain-containing protein